MAATPVPMTRVVRVAVDPAQHRVLSPDSMPQRHASLISGYARLVSEQTGMAFQERRYSSTTAALQAVCDGQADLMLLLGPLEGVPCDSLAASPAYYRGQTLVASRHQPDGPGRFGGPGQHRVAVVQGSRYSGWLAMHYPQLQVIGMPDLHGALSAVETGVADVAVGLDVVVRPMVRRDYADSLLLHVAPPDLPGSLHLVARNGDRDMLGRIEAAMNAISPQQHAQLLQQWAKITYFGAPSLTVLAHHFRWELGAVSLALLVLLTGGLWLRRQQRSAQRNARRQARFIGVMSHEVRNAAQALVTSVDLLSQSGLDQGQRKLVNAARTAGVGLRQLLGHALDYSRLAAGQFRPNPGWHDLQQMARDCVAMVQPAAEAKGLVLSLQCTPDPLPRLWVDGDALRQVLSNLLGNALKFTGQGRIQVSMALLREPGATQLRLDVSDTGIGIPAHRQANVFRPFSQAHDAYSRELGGAGLGLSICRDIAQALGGRIRVCSEPGQGSCFEVVLPVLRDSEAAVPPALPLSGRSVLLVEDHPLNLAFTTRQLVALGATVRTSSDGLGALRAQAAEPSAIVLLDCSLADMSGYHLAVSLRRMEQQRQRMPATLVALSAAHSPGHIERCQQSGMDAILCKPLDTAELLKALGLPAAAGAAAPALPSQDPARPQFHRSLLEEHQALQRAARARDAGQLQYHAHRLAGVLQLLGLPAAAEVAGDLYALDVEIALERREIDRLLRHLEQVIAALDTDAMA